MRDDKEEVCVGGTLRYTLVVPFGKVEDRTRRKWIVVVSN